jgi:hypothetical protein
MKNTFKVLGIIVLFAVIGFSMVACGGDDGDAIPSVFLGAWKYNNQVLFSISANGTGTIGNQGGYKVKVLDFQQTSGSVKFSQGSTETGRFTFSFNGDGAMWIQSGTGPFAAWANIGTPPRNWVIQPAIPTTLRGTWKYNNQLLFSISADGTGAIGNQGGYSVDVIIPKVIFTQVSTETGRFTFRLNGDGDMWIQSGTGPFAVWANIAPDSSRPYVIIKR